MFFDEYTLIQFHISSFYSPEVVRSWKIVKSVVPEHVKLKKFLVWTLGFLF